MAAKAIVFTFLFVSIALTWAKKSTLLNVIQVYRHGERSPAAFYENDPYQDISYWGISTGQLTNVGKRQHYELGQFTKKRYSNFLPARYDRANFLVQTTYMDRTHMSAASQLSGLFPPKGDQIWNKAILWQPIPIFAADTAVISPYDSCTRLSTLSNDLLTTEEYFVNLNNEYQDLFEYLTINSGTNVTSITGAGGIYDTLYIEDRQNFVLPEWTKSVYPEPLRTLGAINFLLYSYTEELKILTSGPFLNALIEQFDGYLDGSSTYKYLQYSGHDVNIASILNSLGAFYPVIAPTFASTLYFELRERDGTNFINIYYKNYGGPEPITVAGCDFDCNWDDFKSIVSNRTITSDEWYELCDA